MPKFPLIGPSYTSQSLNADCQSTINLYPESIESGAGNNQIVLYPAPGTELFADLTQNVSTEPNFFTPVVGSGGFVGDVLTQSYTPTGHDILVGDVIFFSWTTQHAINNALVLSITDNACISGFTQISPTLTNATNFSMQIWMGVVTTPILSGNTYTAVTTFSDLVANADGTSYMNWFRGIGTLDQVNGGLGTSNNGPATYSGFPITTTGTKVVLGFLGGAPITMARPNYKACNGNIGQFISVHYADFPIGIDYKSPAGTYGGTWQQQVGAGNVQVCLVNASFNLGGNINAGNIRGMFTIGVL